jgi:hypothetical protein
VAHGVAEHVEAAGNRPDFVLAPGLGDLDRGVALGEFADRRASPWIGIARLRCRSGIETTRIRRQQRPVPRRSNPERRSASSLALADRRAISAALLALAAPRAVSATSLAT